METPPPPLARRACRGIAARLLLLLVLAVAARMLFFSSSAASDASLASTISATHLRALMPDQHPPPSARTCPLDDAKLFVVAAAEPLIAEEPLKPWLTLKRNLNNIKYLPEIMPAAEIDGRRRHAYVDVGSRSYGSSIGSWFKKRYPKRNHTFHVYAIEADPAFHGDYAGKKGVTLLPYAAWVRNETLQFEINDEPSTDTKAGAGRGMGRIRPVRDEDASAAGVSTGQARRVQAFDFAEWLNGTFDDSDYVVMKMDVEGTEFELLPRLLETGAICLIDELFLECHYNRWQKCCPGVRSPKYSNTYGDCLRLFTSMRASGILVHQWW